MDKKFYFLILKLFKWSKNNLALIICLVSLLVGSLLTYFHHSEKNQDLSLGPYKIVKDEGIFSIPEEKLSNIERMIVVTPDVIAKRDIVVKDKGADHAKIYRNVSKEQFDIYLDSVLVPYIKSNKDFNLVYRNNYEDIAGLLGFSEDPEKKLKQENERDQGILNDLLSIISALILMGVMFVLIRNNQNITTKASLVLPSDLDDYLDDLIGMEDIKAELLQFEDMHNNRELYSKYNVAKNFNILMTGPAGTGKTKVARCLAKKLNIPLIYGSAAGLESGYVGGGNRALKDMVKQASKFERAIIFLDEGEMLFKNRAKGLRSYETQTINSFLSIVDGVNTTKSEIIWIVATNFDEHKMDMDEAALRRFPLKINFRLPNIETRKAILDFYLSKVGEAEKSLDINTSHVAGVTSGFSPAILATLVDRASMIAIKANSKVTQNILLQAFERVAIGLTDRETTAAKFDSRLLIARHEVGHFMIQFQHYYLKFKGDFTLVKEHIPVIKISTEAVSKLGALGFVLSKEKDVKLDTREEYEWQIKQLYGGMCAEEIYYGAAGVTAGAHDDIKKVTAILNTMICQLGFYQDFKINYSVLDSQGSPNTHQLKLIEAKSKEFYDQSKDILLANQPLMDKLVSELMDNYVIGVDKALDIVQKNMK